MEGKIQKIIEYITEVNSLKFSLLLAGYTAKIHLSS